MIAQACSLILLSFAKCEWIIQMKHKLGSWCAAIVLLDLNTPDKKQ